MREYAELARLAMASDCRIERVVMFGSIATGRATSRSDVDLLVVLRDHPLPPMERIPEYLGWFVRGSMPVDVFPMTVNEIRETTGTRGAFARQAEEQGIELAPQLNPV